LRFPVLVTTICLQYFAAENREQDKRQSCSLFLLASYYGKIGSNLEFKTLLFSSCSNQLTKEQKDSIYRQVGKYTAIINGITGF